MSLKRSQICIETIKLLHKNPWWQEIRAFCKRKRIWKADWDGGYILWWFEDIKFTNVS